MEVKKKLYFYGFLINTVSYIWLRFDIEISRNYLPHFFCYKREISLLKQAKNMDPSYKTDPDLRDCLGQEIILIQIS